MQHRQDEPKVRGHRSLAGEQRLDAFLDREVGAVDLVVEGDDLVRQLQSPARSVARVAACTERTIRFALPLQRVLQLGELLVERDP